MSLNNSTSLLERNCFFLHPLSNTQTTPYVVLTCVLNALAFLPTILGSSVILVTMWRNPNLDSPNHIYLYSLAAADFITGLLVQPCYIIHKIAWLYGNGRLSCTARIITEVIAWISAAVSCTTVSLISFDRMLALKLHMRYELYVTRRRAIQFTLLIWLNLIFMSLTRFFTKTIKPLVFIGAIGILSGMVNVLFAYGKIFRYMRHHRKKIGLHLPSIRSTSDSMKSKEKTVEVKKLWKSAMNLAYVVGLFMLVYLPFVSTLIAYLVHGPTTQIDIAYDITRTIVFCASILNPFFYCWKIIDVRTEVLKTWNKIKKRLSNLSQEKTVRENNPTSIQSNDLQLANVIDNNPD